jgi:hypothetical protein
MVFIAHICKKKNMLTPEKKGQAPELFLVLSTPAIKKGKEEQEPLCVIHYMGGVDKDQLL